MTLTSKENVIFSSIVNEFEISNSIVEKSQQLLVNLTNSRIEICKLFKMQNFMMETLELSKKNLIESINVNKFRINNNERNKLELRDKIKATKENIKTLRLNVKELEGNIYEEKQQSKILHQDLQIYISREKFKFIKKLIIKKYKKVYLNYDSELCIKVKIKQCNERKSRMRKKELFLKSSIDKYNKKISNYRSSLSEIRKSTLRMLKNNDLSTVKIKRVMNYKEVENEFRIAIISRENQI